MATKNTYISRAIGTPLSRAITDRIEIPTTNLDKSVSEAGRAYSALMTP